MVKGTVRTIRELTGDWGLALLLFPGSKLGDTPGTLDQWGSEKHTPRTSIGLRRSDGYESFQRN